MRGTPVRAGRPLRVGDARGPAGTIDAVTWGRPRGGRRCDVRPRGDGRGRGTPAEGRRQGGRRGGAGDLRAGGVGAPHPREGTGAGEGRRRGRGAPAEGCRRGERSGKTSAQDALGRRMPARRRTQEGDAGGGTQETSAQGALGRHMPARRRTREGDTCGGTPARGMHRRYRRRPCRGRGDGRRRGEPAEGRRRGGRSGSAGDSQTQKTVKIGNCVPVPT